jgi:hypothetical protein
MFSILSTIFVLLNDEDLLDALCSPHAYQLMANISPITPQF